MSKNDSIPKYLQIKHALKKEIAEGIYKPGDKIPSENVLPARFQASRLTAVKAIQELVNEGVLERRKGSGTYISESAKKMVLSIGTFDDMDWIFEIFEKENPGVEISKTIYTHENFYDVTQNSRLDLMHLTEFHLDCMASRKNLLDLTDRFEDILFEEPLFYEEVLRLFEYRRKQYAIPLLFSPQIIFYNRKLFQDYDIKVPTGNWRQSDFLKLALDVKAGMPSDISPFILAQNWNRWPVYIIQNGGEIVSSQGQCTIGEKKSLDAVKWIYDLFFKYKICPLLPNMTKELSRYLFQSGKSAMILDTYYSLTQYSATSKMDLGILPFPAGNLNCTGLIGDAFAISSASENTDLALKFIRFVISDEIQQAIKSRGLGIPAVKSTAESPCNIPGNMPKHEYMRFIAETNRGRKLISTSSPERLKPLWHEMDKVWAGLESPENACRNAQELYNKNNVSSL